MSIDRPIASYDSWSATCDTLHAETQILGKLAVALAPPEPQLQHGALRQTARGWETYPLPAPGGGVIVVALDLREHQAVIERSGNGTESFPLGPDRPVAAVTAGILDAIARLAGPVVIDPKPQEVTWTVPLDQDEEHHTYDAGAVENFFAASTRAAQVLTELRAPWRGRDTPVNAWWGSFDLAVNFFSGHPADPPSDDFIMRNAMDAQEVAIGWWPGDPRHPEPAFYAYAHPAPDHFSEADLSPAAGGWDDALGEFILDDRDAAATGDHHAAALEFGRATFAHACHVCEWNPILAATAQGTPPPIR
ncbi:MAG: DUF5996 family protein [Actinomycetota bacterium]|nr:DUF5996 family protein [Actinomycetota bacterium]